MVVKPNCVSMGMALNNWHLSHLIGKWISETDLNDIAKKALQSRTIWGKPTVGALSFWTTRTSNRVNTILVQNGIYFIEELTQTPVETLQSFGLQNATIKKINEILSVRFGRDFKGLPWINTIH